MKKSVSLLLAWMMVISIITSMPLTVNAASKSDLTFELKEDGKSYSITGCNEEASGKLIIPNTYKNLPVTNIEGYTFNGCEKLTSVTIPDSVTSIGYGAFAYCDELTSISVDSENAHYFSKNGVLYDRENNSLIQCPSGKNGKVVVPDGIVKIDEMAFENCTEISSISLPDSVSEIGARAFQLCSAKKINIPKKVKTIEYRTFASSGIEEIVIHKNIKLIDRYAFAWCPSLKRVEFVNGSLNTINDYAFYECEKLNDISIPENLIVTIECGVFGGTGYANNSKNWDKGILYLNKRIIDAKPEKLKGEIKIKEGIVHVVTRAFEGCDGITSVVIPKSMVALGGYSFGFCENLKKVRIKSDNVIMQTSNNIGIFAGPFDCSYIYENDSYWQDNVLYIDGYLIDTKYDARKSYTVKAGTRGIAARAFEGFENLKKITVPASVNVIDELAIGYIRDSGNYSVKIKDFTIYGVKGSVAEKYAQKNKFTFSEMKCTSHTSSSWKTVKKATVNAAGKKQKVCTMCGEILKTAKIPQLKCSKPTLKSIENTEHGVLVKWNKVSGADKYRVYRKTSKGDWKYLASTSKTYFTDKTAKSGTKYYYAIKARNEAGNSSLSESLSKLYLADPTLKTPSSTSKGIGLKWTKVTGAQGYIIYRKTGSGSYTKLKTEKGVSNLSYRDTSAKKGTKYYYKVKAYKSKTYSAYSNTKAITDKY